ncbi:hypothetical protein MKW92_041436 [Papaver armeniacum]|nr:hypothetical protein MKW92_041436 [Papaver armeniacum]
MQVPLGITPRELLHLIDLAARPGAITFTDDDLPPEGRDHNKGLYITIGWENMIIPSIFMDNGAGVNICTLKAAKKIRIDLSRVTKNNKSALTVRGFDKGKQIRTGEITLEIWVGPMKTKATFLLMDILASFNMLLGRPWMHKNGIGASSLHQKARFSMGNELITIHADNGENEIRAHKSSMDMVPMIDNYTMEIRYETAAEVASRHARTGQFKYQNRNVPKMLQKSKFFPGMRLGLRQQGTTQTITIPGRKAFDIACLGYQSTHQNSMTFRKKQEDQGIDWSRQPSF